VLEAVYRFQLGQYGDKQELAFLALEMGADPPDELVKRFAGDSPRVLPGSMAAGDATTGVTHKETGQRGRIFGISAVEWVDKDTAEVNGGYYKSGLSAAYGSYVAKRRDGKWVVTVDETKPKWIS
jgi:hypothetical protein